MQLPDFLAQLTDVEEEHDGYVAKCPSHEDSRPSLRISVSDRNKVLLRCRAGCKTGDVMAGVGLSMRDLAGMEPGDVSFTRATSTNTPAGSAETARLAADLDRWAEAYGGAAAEYAERRFGITPQDAQRVGLGLSTDLPGAPRLVVPFRDREGVPRGFQARALGEARVRWLGPESPEGKSWAKVGYLGGSSGWAEVVVCEGPGDGLTAVAMGYDTIFIAGAAHASNDSVIDTVEYMVNERPVVIAGDGDSAGRQFAATLGQRLAARGLRVGIIDVPDGSDLSEWHEDNPREFQRSFIRAIVGATPVTSGEAALTSRSEERYPLSELGNARFVRDYVIARGSEARYSPEAGFFLLGDGVWRPDGLDRIRTFTQEAADIVDTIAKALMDSALDSNNTAALREARRWRSWAKHSQSSNGISATIRELQALPGVATDVNDFDRHEHYLACRNGVVDLRTGDLRPHDSTLLLTRRIELDYDPEAEAPRWERFLSEVFHKHDALPAYIQRLVGYGITGSTAEQCFAVLWGTGANGKSVFTDTLTEVFREITVTTPFSTFEDKPSGGIPNDIAALKGSRLVMASEGEQGRAMAESILKRVTGRDLIAARFMRKEFFEFRPTFLLMLATNFRPQFRGQDEGLWRRVKLIPWERYFDPTERDHGLGQKLLKEAPGIFAWAVRGAVAWYANGLNDPNVVRDGTREYRETSDALTGFMPGQFVKGTAEDKVMGNVLWDAYTAWADEEGLPQREVWTRKAFFAALEERGLAKRKSNAGIVFYGVRRARKTDGIEISEEERTPAGALAHYGSRTDTHPSSGPSLDDIL